MAPMVAMDEVVFDGQAAEVRRLQEDLAAAHHRIAKLERAIDEVVKDLGNARPGLVSHLRTVLSHPWRT